mmetsp:Transcript_40471/g.87643  ORF Transcript_40471/g.87643 Transcript_40471/m.87643 type:complete len:309 (+) Transcript_40471:542-1468(+)
MVQGEVAVMRMEQRNDQGQNTQVQHHSTPCRALGDSAEDGHEDHSSEASPEDEGLSHGRLLFAAFGLGSFKSSIIHLHELPSKGANQAHDARENEISQQRHGGHLSADVQHGGGNISHGRPRTSGVGCHDHQAAQLHSEGIFLHQFLQEGHHDDDHCQVVQHRGEQEGQDADDDQQLLLLGRLDRRGDDVESLVRIHDLHHCQSTHQEEDHLADVVQGLRHSLLELLTGHRHSGANQSPHHDTQDERRGGFVNFKDLLQDDDAIACDEGQDDGQILTLFPFHEGHRQVTVLNRAHDQSPQSQAEHHCW